MQVKHTARQVCDDAIPQSLSSSISSISADILDGYPMEGTQITKSSGYACPGRRTSK